MGNFSSSLLDQMGARIAHRGPDDAGTSWLPDQRVGLVHRRLAIIDLSPLGHQPMWSEDGEIGIVFNGEIYNYRELRRELLGKGMTFRGGSDTEVLLAAYRQYGEAMLARLNGIFAFVICDRRRRRLFLARDGAGVKPLYYAQTPKGFLFASELKALLAEPSLDRDLDPAAVAYHLAYLWCPAPFTMLKSVRKLEPGCAMVVHEGRVERHWRYYDLPNGAPIPLDERDAVTQVEQSLRRAVERQMVADVEVGAFLSGGLDSSAIVTFAREFVPQGRLRCFTIGFNDRRWEQEGMAADLPYATRVARHLGVGLEVIHVGPEIVDRLQEMIFHLDEPQADPASLNARFICQLARSHGIKVLLSGAGGDDIFSGYRRHYALAQERWWSWLPARLRRELSGAVRHFPTRHPLGRRLVRAFQYAGLEGDERLTSYFYWTAPERIKRLCADRLKDAATPASVSAPLRAALNNLPRDAPALNRMLYLEAKYFLADHNLNYTDKMAMAEGVEVRVPFLDPDLVSLAARLPVRYKQHGRTGKWILKKVMERHLPHDVVYRPKTGFGAPIRAWLRAELREMVDDLLSPTSLSRRGLFDPHEVRWLIAQDRAGKVDGAYTIFSLLCIEVWCRLFLDGSRLAHGTA